jgi:hypothetical protein
MTKDVKRNDQKDYVIDKRTTFIRNKQACGARKWLARLNGGHVGKHDAQ